MYQPISLNPQYRVYSLGEYWFSSCKTQHRILKRPILTMEDRYQKAHQLSVILVDTTTHTLFTADSSVEDWEAIELWDIPSMGPFPIALQHTKTRKLFVNHPQLASQYEDVELWNTTHLDEWPLIE